MKLTMIHKLCQFYDPFAEGKAPPVLREEIQQWCKENLKKPWRVWQDSSEKTDVIDVNGQELSISMLTVFPSIEFEDDAEAVLFKMRWG